MPKFRKGASSNSDSIIATKPFKALPWQKEPWSDKSPTLLITGSCGGGKSFFAGNKVHGFLLRYPGATGLVLRKERATLSNSTILFIKREVVGKDGRIVHSKSNFRLEYPNGSVMIFGGMKDAGQRERIRSIGQKGGVDICWMEEATQFAEEDFNEILARMRGRAAPWTQIILTTNPDSPGHWINRRLILGGEASVYYSSASDNPYNPDSYVDSLKSLSGVQYRRLVCGEWAAGSGRVIDTWLDNYNPASQKDYGGNVSVSSEYNPGAGPIVWAIDDGYSGEYDEKTKMYTGKSHPRAILAAQLCKDGAVHIFAESYAVKKLATQHLEEFIAECDDNGWPMPSYVVRDRAAASLGGAIDNLELPVNYNQMLVDESIKELRQWVAADENDVRRVKCHPRCQHLRYELQTYSVNDKGGIIKEHDNGVDALRYLVWDLAYGTSPIVDVASIGGVIDSGY